MRNIPAKRNQKKGFTLAELLVVVAIIAVLAGIAVSIYTISTRKAESAVCLSNRDSLRRKLQNEQMLGDVKLSDYSAQGIKSAGYACPSGGTITVSHNEETGVYTVTCSKHGSALSVTTYAPITGTEGVGQLMQSSSVTDFFTKLGNSYTNGITSSLNSADPAIAAQYPQLKEQLSEMLSVDGTNYDFRIYKKNDKQFMIYVYDATGKKVNDSVTVKAYEYDLSDPASPKIDDNYEPKSVKLVSYKSTVDKTSNETFLGLQSGVKWDKKPVS